jgi:hypothetical protein
VNDVHHVIIGHVHLFIVVVVMTHQCLSQPVDVAILAATDLQHIQLKRHVIVLGEDAEQFHVSGLTDQSLVIVVLIPCTILGHGF